MVNDSVFAYVSDAVSDFVRVKVLDNSIVSFLKDEGFLYDTEDEEWFIQISEDKKPYILQRLRDKDIYFSYGPGGWPPGAVFEYLREQNKVSGIYLAISWINHEKYVITRR